MMIMELIHRALVLPLFTRLATSSPFWTSISLSMKFRKQFLVSLFHNNLVRLKRGKEPWKCQDSTQRSKVVRSLRIVGTRVVWFLIPMWLLRAKCIPSIPSVSHPSALGNLAITMLGLGTPGRPLNRRKNIQVTQSISPLLLVQVFESQLSHL